MALSALPPCPSVGPGPPRRCENATERMMEFAALLDPKCKPTKIVKKGDAVGPGGVAIKADSWRDLPVEKRIEHALIKVRARGLVGWCSIA